MAKWLLKDIFYIYIINFIISGEPQAGTAYEPPSISEIVAILFIKGRVVSMTSYYVVRLS